MNISKLDTREPGALRSQDQHATPVTRRLGSDFSESARIETAAVSRHKHGI
ncbi:MAG: hypothetical protein O9341_17385 [Paucibacter sp.]|nr:hypothetical protein [Roseateles sp.]